VEKNGLTPKAVFDRAHELPPGERPAYLDQVCAGEPALREQVEALLRAYEEAGSFLQTPALAEQATGAYRPARPPSDEAETVPPRPRGHEPFGAEEASTLPPRPPGDDAPLREGPGTRIGPYRLIEEIGHGGMGAVYLAGQEQPVRRQVALKIIKPGMDSDQVVARFEAERQALALMDHAYIAKVFDAGATATGRPFFVMELVRGVPITKYCDDNKLTPRERLELFIPVCQAIQHAHQKGIIHRDIKPSNVLVAVQDAKPVPKVIDFGIAKATEQPLTEKTLATQLGTVIGTLEYMSPEQADYGAQGIDTRSDIYSLGVLLYELLTSSTPLDRQRLRDAGFPGVLLMIQEEEPPRPSTRLSRSGEQLPEVSAQRQTEPAKLVRLLRGDLDWIVMKCLEKDRNRRYESASALARDLERYLHDEPVEARPPSTGYLLKKFARKHRALLLTAGGFVGLLVLGVIGLTVGIVMVNDARVAKTREQEQTRRALNTMTDDVIGELIAKRARLRDKERKFLLKVRGLYEALATRLGDTQESRAVAAEGQFRLARIRDFLGEPAAAEAGYRRAIALYQGLVSEFPAVAVYRDELAQSQSSLGLLSRDLEKLPQAMSAFREAVALWSALAGEFPAEKEFRYRRAVAQLNHGLALGDFGKKAEAKEAYGQAIAGLARLVREDPKNALYRYALANGYTNLGLVWSDLGKEEAAERAYEGAIALRKKLAADAPDEPDYQNFLARSQFNLAICLHKQGKRQGAERAYRQAIASQKKLVDEFPAVPRYRTDLADDLKNLGALVAERGNLSEAAAVYREAIHLQKKLVADSPKDPQRRVELAGTYGNLANAVRDDSKPTAALPWYDKAVALLKPIAARAGKAAGARPVLRNAHWDRANALGQLGRHDDAVKDWQRALDLNDQAADRTCLQLSLEAAKAEVKLKTAGSARRGAEFAGVFYGTGRLYAAAAAAAAASSDDSLHRQYVSRALALLRQARDAGFFRQRRHAEDMKKDRVFDSLKAQPDFQKFMGGLAAR
jgi:serine/threonine protein kinase/tetratricopeptide (TPR) repeat protein